MALRTAAEVADLIQAITELGYNFHTTLNGTLTTDLDALETQIAVGDVVPENAALTSAVSQFISSVGRAWEAWKAIPQAAAPALGRLGASPDLGNFNQNLDFFQQYLVTNSIELEFRGYTKDTASTVVGSGAGVSVMASVDLNGDVIDFGHVEDFVLECSKDYSQGAVSGAEEFRVRGEDMGGYPWEEGGSGLNASYNYPFGLVSADFAADQKKGQSGGTIKSIGASSAAGNLLRNGDFESAITGTDAAKLPQWTFNGGTQTAIAQETSDPINGVYSLAASDDFEVDQFLTQGRVKSGTFVSLAIKVERVASATGTLTVRLMDADEGTTHGTLTVDISTLTNGVPVVRALVPFDVPLNAEDLKVQVELASLATGTIKIDDVMLSQATLVNGYLIALFDGTTQDASGYALGRYKKGDSFTIETTSTDAGLIQKYFSNIALGRYFRSAAMATAGWEDPS